MSGLLVGPGIWLAANVQIVRQPDRPIGFVGIRHPAFNLHAAIIGEKYSGKSVRSLGLRGHYLPEQAKQDPKAKYISSITGQVVAALD